MGRLILDHEGTLERFTGDGLMVFFNDPVPVPDAPERAVRMAVAMRDRVGELAAKWRREGYELDLGLGIARGFATLGAIGFEGRWDYAALGTVTNLAARLCGEARGRPDPRRRPRPGDARRARRQRAPRGAPPQGILAAGARLQRHAAPRLTFSPGRGLPTSEGVVST